MKDPRKKDPQFPDRPEHEDFIRLSEVAQAHDETDRINELRKGSLGEYVEIDEGSLMYLAKHRIGMAELAYQYTITGVELMAIWIDGFTIGKKYAESIERDEE